MQNDKSLPGLDWDFVGPHPWVTDIVRPLVIFKKKKKKKKKEILDLFLQG